MAANDTDDVSAKEALILWRPRTDGAPLVRVVRLGEDEDDYVFSGGAAYAQWRDVGEIERRLLMMIAFHTIVVREGISPEDVHRAFLSIPEYRAIISPDIKGAD